MADLLNEAMHDAATEAAELKAINDFEEDVIEEAPSMRFAMPDLSFLAAPTGDGPIEAYIEHPLNFDHAKSTARILRGATGICGNLNYALVDIALGVIEKIQEKGKKQNETPAYYGQ